jgi:hypothetical protein
MMVQWPTYWQQLSSCTTPQTLCCSNSIVQPKTPTISFAASLLSLEDYSTCGSPGPSCNSIYALSTQSDAFNTATPPPLPVTIVGTGFGYLSQTLPIAVSDSSFVLVSNDGAVSGTPWNTNTGSCQMYIANWTDTSISLVANIPIGEADLDSQTLSPLSDVSPLTFFSTSADNPVWNCKVANGDTLTFKVTNPQNAGAGWSGPISACVGMPGMQACP